jgi:hypothetical protein
MERVRPILYSEFIFKRDLIRIEFIRAVAFVNRAMNEDFLRELQILRENKRSPALVRMRASFNEAPMLQGKSIVLIEHRRVLPALRVLQQVQLMLA